MPAYVFVCVCVLACDCARSFVCMNGCLRACVCMYVFVRVRLFVCVCV